MPTAFHDFARLCAIIRHAVIMNNGWELGQQVPRWKNGTWKQHYAQCWSKRWSVEDREEIIRRWAIYKLGGS